MNGLKVENLSVEDIDGWHDDGWCNRLLRGRFIARADASSFYVSVWVKGENGRTKPVIASLSIGFDAPLIADVPPDSPTTIQVPVALAPGQEVSFRVFCENQLQEKGSDARDLSFVLLGIGVQ
jgi:hypothetical protein